jgi:hypothetical protein
VLAIILYLCLLYVARKTGQYFLAPHIIGLLVAEFADSELQATHLHLQQLRKRAITRGSWLLIPCFLGIILIGAFAAQNPGGSVAPLQVPDALKAPRVVTNLQGLTKKVFLEDARLGDVTDIVFRNNPSGELRETVFVGTMGALFNDTGLHSRFVPFEKRQDHINFIQLNSSGVYGFMNRGAWCSDASVMDQTGKPMWSYSAKSNGIDDMASGDLDGDGIPEFAVGFNGGGGIHLLNNQGKKLWEFPDGNVWHVEIADLDGSGQKKIVHSNASGNITVRDKQGKILSRIKPEPYFSDFSLIRYPDATSPERLLLVEDDTVWIFDSGANVLAKFPAPNSGSLGKGKGALIAINNGKYALATIANYENWHRSIIYLHDLSGNILYQEILPESCPTIAVLPAGEAQPERLVIGCEGQGS